MKRVSLVLIVLCLAGCSAQRKLENITRSDLRAGLAVADERILPEIGMEHADGGDTLSVEDGDGKKVLIMKAVRDEDGEMVATDVIAPARVVSKFRNVAERHGKVDLVFDVIVPASLQDSRWQLRFFPVLRMQGDSLGLDPVIITGRDFREAQLRGYQQYEKFLSSIITDSARFLYIHQLEVFLERNLPQIYRFRDDTSHVCDEEFYSGYGVNERMAVEHYTKSLLLKHNRRKAAKKDMMFGKYVKTPIETDGLRLDTVIVGIGDDVIYRYVQTVKVRPGLKKAVITLPGEIRDMDRILYRIPPGDSLTFYISSLSTLMDDRKRYVSKVVSRRVEDNTFCYIEFLSGDDKVDPGLGENRKSISTIRKNLISLLENREYDMDSILVSAWCSPEGDLRYNSRLSQARAESVSAFFRDFLSGCTDSLELEEGVIMDMAGNVTRRKRNPIRFLSRSNGENWTMLDSAVKRDSILTPEQKEDYFAISESHGNQDEREEAMSLRPYYRYLREKIYPSLRTVRFDFYLHRKGMVKDTVHTTELDTVYMNGLRALKDLDYKGAATRLRPYRDFNTAVAYCALDYNASALEILEDLDKTDKVLYMLALIHSRRNEDAKAVMFYRQACEKNPSLVSRGNLDPEISTLVDRYGLDRQQRLPDSPPDAL